MKNIIDDLKILQDFLDKDSNLQKTLIKAKSIVEDFIGGNNKWDMYLLNPQEAIEYWNDEAPIKELYQLFDDGSESLIETDEDFKILLESGEEWFGADNAN